MNKAAEDFKCRVCEAGCGEQREEEEKMEVEGGTLQVVDQFCYLGETMTCEAGAETALRTRITTAWGKWREIASLLVNRKIPLRSRVYIYCACIRPVMLYGAETWPTTREMERILRSSDCKMLRYMAHLKWEDRVTNEEVMRRCGVEDVISKLRRDGLRWYGHIKRREEGHVLRKALELEVEGGRKAGRPKKTWRRCVEEDTKEKNIDERSVYNRQDWRRLIARPTP